MTTHLAAKRTATFIGTSVLAASLFAALTGCAAAAPPASSSTTTATPASDKPGQTQGRLSQVLDGKTLVISPVDVQGKSTGKPDITVRLLGIDTPEVAQGPTETGANAGTSQCGGEEAKAELKRNIGANDFIVVVFDPKVDHTDSQGRTLAYATTQGVVGKNGLEEGSDLGGAMINGGFASAWYPQGGTEPKKFAGNSGYKKTAERAKAQKSGAWASCDTLGKGVTENTPLPTGPTG